MKRTTPPRRRMMLNVAAWVSASALSLTLIMGSVLHSLPLDITETLGFVSGAFTVWLAVKENVWNWPIGIINNIFFIVLFWNARLYADMSLQFFYILLSFYGWYWWLRGGKNHNTLHVSRISLKEVLFLCILGVLATVGMSEYLAKIHDVAPFLDALTTVLSLIAQYMLTRKYLESWYVWVAVDIVYVYLYAIKALPLTATLYVLFLCMCGVGFVRWKKTLHVKKVVKGVGYEKRFGHREILPATPGPQTSD